MRAVRGSFGRRGFLCVGAALFAPPALAKRRRPRAVKVAEVRSRVKRRNRDVKRTLRQLLERELSKLDIAPSERYLLSARLVTLRTRRKTKYSETRCVVRATLRRERGGVLLAAISGRASARERAPQVAELETSAMQAAVRSALSGLDKALTSA